MRVVNDRRVKPRVALRGDAIIYSAHEQLPCYCLDVSAGGIAVLGPRAARVRERVIIQAWFGQSALHAEAVVVRSRRTPDGHLWGMRFVRMDEQVRRNLEGYVQQMLLNAARVRQAQLFAARTWGQPMPTAAVPAPGTVPTPESPPAPVQPPTSASSPVAPTRPSHPSDPSHPSLGLPSNPAAGGAPAARGWSRPVREPIELPRGDGSEPGAVLPMAASLHEDAPAPFDPYQDDPSNAEGYGLGSPGGERDDSSGRARAGEDAAPVFDPNVVDEADEVLSDETSGVGLPPTSPPDRPPRRQPTPMPGADEEVEAYVAMLEARSGIDADALQIVSPHEAPLSVDANEDEDETQEQAALEPAQRPVSSESVAESSFSGPIVPELRDEGDEAQTRARPTPAASTPPRAGLGPVQPPSFDEDAETHQMNRAQVLVEAERIEASDWRSSAASDAQDPPTSRSQPRSAPPPPPPRSTTQPPADAPSFEEWERCHAAPAAEHDASPAIEGLDASSFAGDEPFPGVPEPALYGSSREALPFPGEEEPPPSNHKTPTPSLRLRAPVLLDGESEILDADAAIFGEIEEAAERERAAYASHGRAYSPVDLSVPPAEEPDDTGVMRAPDPEQYTPVGTRPALEMMEPTPVGAIESETGNRPDPRIPLAVPRDDTMPMSVPPRGHASPEPADASPLSYAVLPDYEHELEHDDDGSEVGLSQSGFTVVANMEDFGLRTPAPVDPRPPAAPSHDVGDYRELPQFGLESEPGTLSGYTMVASPDSWTAAPSGPARPTAPDAPSRATPAVPPGGFEVPPAKFPTAPPAAEQSGPGWARPGGPVSFGSPDASPLAGFGGPMPSSIRFEDEATTVDGPAAPSRPPAGPTGSHAAVGKVGPLFDRRALVEDALAQLRARNGGGSKAKEAPETEDERARRNQRRDKREGRDHRLQELYEAALADLDKPPPR